MAAKSEKGKTMNKNEKKGIHLHFSTGVVALALTILGLVLFQMSYKTGYYVYGEMNSTRITALIGAAIAFELIFLVMHRRFHSNLIVQLIPFVITALLAWAAILIIGDRVEGIGNCIITDYDSGHGGEEAIYMSLIGAASLLAAMIYNIGGAFTRSGTAQTKNGKSVAVVLSGCVIGIAALVATVMLTGAGAPGSKGETASGSSKADNASAEGGELTSGTYRISFNQNNGNLESMPDYQFLSSNMGGLANADARFYIDLNLELDGKGSYSLVSDSYVMEAGKRAEKGDPTGLGFVYTTTSEGTYTDNGDGTVTTAAADHVKFELTTDTYSAQMKSMMNLDPLGTDADGEYDSADYPVVLDYVPETVWTLGDGEIVSYAKPALKGDFAVSFNQNNGNLESMPDYQFLSSNMTGLANADARFYIDLNLSLDGQGSYSLVSDAYVLEAGKRAEKGDPTGLGLVYKTTSEGTYTDNGDGTVTTAAAEHVKFELTTDTYSAQMKSMMNLDPLGTDADGEYDSADNAAVLDYVPETIWTLDTASNAIVSYESTAVEEEAEVAGAGAGEAPAAGAADAEAAGAEKTEAAGAAAEPLVVTSDDGGTKMTFNPDGTYVFAFEAHNIEDPGTWTYADGKLVVTNANGDEVTAEGDPLKFKYVSAVSDQLTGDFTVKTDDLEAEAAPEEAPAAGAADAAEAAGEEKTEAAGAAAEPLVVTSDDGGTKMTFNPDGTYVFAFEAHNIEDPGTWTYADGKLVVTNANGDEVTAEGDPLKFKYVSAVSDQLTGDFTVNAADLATDAAEAAPAADAGTEETPAASTAAEPLVVTSDDGGTKMTFNPDGTYVFAFEAHNIEDPGTWTYADGKLVVTNANGDEVTAEGDPLKFKYVSAVSDQLTGDFTVNAADLVGDAAEATGEEKTEAAGAAAEPLVVTSDDGGTKMTFNPDGTYVFAFEAHNIEDPGTWKYENGKLTVTNANKAEVTAEGDPLKFKYVSAVSDQLTGDFTIPADKLK